MLLLQYLLRKNLCILYESFNIGYYNITTNIFIIAIVIIFYINIAMFYVFSSADRLSLL